MSRRERNIKAEAAERRKHWYDRRVEGDRRNAQRLRLVTYDCRSGLPRRQSDIGGELTDGEIWWNKSNTKYE